MNNRLSVNGVCRGSNILLMTMESTSLQKLPEMSFYFTIQLLFIFETSTQIDIASKHVILPIYKQKNIIQHKIKNKTGVYMK